MKKFNVVNNIGVSNNLSLIPLPFNDVPDEMKQIPQWVCWKKVPNGDGTVKKVLINPKTLVYASPTDPTTWADFNKARVQYVRNKRTLSGIGFAFTKDVHLIGIDLDRVRDPLTGQWNHGVEEFISRFASYSELSQSGTGCHIILKGTLPDGWRKKVIIDGIAVEIYDEKHYFVVTGQPIEGMNQSINPITDEALEYLRPSFEGKSSIHTIIGGEDQVCPSVTPEDEFGEKLLIEAFLESASEKAVRLYNGDTSDYNSDQSRCDLALCCYLAPICIDISDLDRLFRRSIYYQRKDAAHRRKWEQRSDYRIKTLQKAMRTVED